MTQRKPDLVCYHSKCPDGFAAAFAAWLKLGDSAEYLPVQYNEDHSHIDFADRDVHILDFSFAPETMEHIGRVAKSLTLLDHHASAQEKLARFKPLCCGKVHFDMGHSGAVLAWHHYHPHEPVPFLLQCIESRDLWHWNVPGDKAYLAWLDCMPQDFTGWETALYLTSHENQRRIELGEAMSLKFQTLCESIAQAAVEVTVAGVKGLAVNASVEFVSEVGELLALKSGTFGVVWRVLPDKRVKCSMRAVKPYSVKALAEQFGGGGHPQSASFVLPRERLMELVDGVLEAPVRELAAS